MRNKDLGPNELKLNIFACTSSLTLRVWCIPTVDEFLICSKLICGRNSYREIINPTPSQPFAIFMLCIKNARSCLIYA